MILEVIVQMALVFVSYWNIGIQGGSFIQIPTVSGSISNTYSSIANALLHLNLPAPSDLSNALQTTSTARPRPHPHPPVPPSKSPTAAPPPDTHVQSH